MRDLWELRSSHTQVPKNIWEQLHKAANSYFLLISFIMFIGGSADVWCCDFLLEQKDVWKLI